MKPRKLTPRLIIVAAVLLLAAYYLYPTFRYERLRSYEEQEASQIAEQMGVSFAMVIENLNKSGSVLQDLLAENSSLPEEQKTSLSDRLQYLQGEHGERIAKYRKKAIKLGLDLQGGMHMVLEVDVVQLMNNIARQRDSKLEQLLIEIDDKLANDPQAEINEVITATFDQAGLKLSQYFGEPGESNSTVLTFITKQADDAINRSLEILRNRIDQFGVSEPSIQKQGSRRIVLELPGVQDPVRARDLIGRTALLEFKLLADPQGAQDFLTEVDKILSDQDAVSDTTQAVEEPAETAEELAAETDTTGEEGVDLEAALEGETTATDTGAVTLEATETPFTALLRGIRGDIAVPAENVRQVRNHLANPKVNKLMPDGTDIIWSARPEQVGDGIEYHLLYFVKKDAELTGSALSDARVDISGGSNNPGSAGQAVVSLSLNRQGARKFSRVTGANINKRLAIVLDNKVFMAPNIRSKIPNGRAVIEGLDDVDEANDIAIVLRAGALPTSVIIEEERTVGPSLGRDSITKGTRSAIIGMILVVIFMAIYYGMSGIIANVALLLNIALIFAGLSFFGAMGMGATLSLPGIAGIILTIGMAVDANVLIFERIREELETGKTVWHAISSGYDRAFTTILDANITTLIAALVLLQFGTGPIKGFAMTLSIGILSSLFTAIVVTRLIFDYITSRRTLERLSI